MDWQWKWCRTLQEAGVCRLIAAGPQVHTISQALCLILHCVLHVENFFVKPIS